MSTYYLAPRVRYDQFTTKFGYPIYLRFSYCGEQAFDATGVYIKERHFWDDKIKKVVDGANFKLKNDAIDRKLKDAEARILKAIADGEAPSVKAFKGRSLESFETYLNQVCQHTGNAQGTIKAIKGCFVKVPDISQINVRWLRQLNDYMLGIGLAQNTRKNYLGGVLRKVLNQAVREGYISKAPDYEYPKEEETTPEYLNTDERLTFLRALLNKKFTGDLHMTLAYFMLGCYSGLRYIDWTRLKFSKHVERTAKSNMIILRAKKNNASITMSIQPGLQKVLAVIKEVGPLTVSYDMILKHLDTIRKELKLDKEIGTHQARHSFGYMCASEGVSKESTAYFMGITLKVVEVYYHLTGKHANDQIKKLRRA